MTFEGTEGSGKSTQCQLLAASLNSLGRRAVVTYEPGGTSLGNSIRQLVLEPDAARQVGARAEALLFAAARAQLVDDVIRPAIERGDDVICDRYIDSTVAYQRGGRGLPADDVWNLIDFATDGLKPDLTFLLDLEATTGLARKRGAGPDRLENEDKTFHDRVRASYLEQARADPGRIVTLDATRSREDLATAILRRVLECLEVRRATRR